MRRERRRGSAEQLHSRIPVAANKTSSPARRREPPGGSTTYCQGMLVRRTKIDQVPVSLLEVVAGDRLELRRPVPTD